MISTRYSLTVIVLTGMALVPTLVHTYAGITSSDGRVTNAIPLSLTDLDAEPTLRSSTWVKSTFDSVDWIERHYEEGDTAPLLLFVARSHDAKRLYHHPELALIHGTAVRAHGITRVASAPTIPVHVLKSPNNTGRDLAIYSFFYDEHFIDDPFVYQLQNSWKLMFSSQKPMTLFFVHDPVASPHIPLEEARATRLLLAAIRSFLSQEPQPEPKAS